MVPTASKYFSPLCAHDAPQMRSENKIAMRRKEDENSAHLTCRLPWHVWHISVPEVSVRAKKYHALCPAIWATV